MLPRTSSIYTRVEPDIKEQAEEILATLGIPVSNAVNLFLHQIVLRKGIPFEVSIPQRHPLNYADLTEEQFNSEIEKGINSMNEGKVVSSAQVRERMTRLYSAK